MSAPALNQIITVFRILVYFEPEAYSGSCQISMVTCFVKKVNGYRYFCNISFSCSLLYEIKITNFFSEALIFTPEVFILRKKVWGPETGDSESWYIFGKRNQENSFFKKLCNLKKQKNEKRNKFFLKGYFEHTIWL